MWDMCQMLNIWHISHNKHKNQLPLDVAYVPKLYHICPYRCKFATVRTDMVKPNNVLYLLLSLLSLPVLTLDFFSLSSHIRPKLPSTTQQRKNKMTLWSDPRRSRSSSWARPLRSDHRHRHCRRRRKWHGQGHSDHRHSDRIIAIIIVVGGASGMGEAPLQSSTSSSSSSSSFQSCRSLFLSFLVVGCFDCWWLADFGWRW